MRPRRPTSLLKPSPEAAVELRECRWLTLHDQFVAEWFNHHYPEALQTASEELKAASSAYEKEHPSILRALLDLATAQKAGPRPHESELTERRALGVSRRTLYSYVSRGLIGVSKKNAVGRGSLYDAVDIEVLRDRKPRGRSHAGVTPPSARLVCCPAPAAAPSPRRAGAP